MSTTYRVLREILSSITEAQSSVVFKYLRDMDDIEFKEIPMIMMTAEQKLVIETYGHIMVVIRGEEEHVIYCIFPSIFRIYVPKKQTT